jgi:hypothetical protein
MLSASDLIRLPYDPTLTLAGVEYAKKSLHYTYDRMGLNTAARLRKIVAGVAVELAFRRWLEAQAVPYDLLGATAFTERDRYDVCLGGRRCDLKSFLISDKAKITALRRDPAWLLDAAALVPLDQFHSETLGEKDLYLFGFLAGLETRRSDDLKKVLAAGQPFYLLHTPETADWLGRRVWRSLGRLVLKSNTRRPLEVEVGGQDASRAAIVEQVRLEPRARTVTRNEFHSLLYLHVPRWPGGALGVRSAVLKQTLLVQPHEWVNLWLYGMEVFLAGWLSKSEFRARSRKLPAGARVKQYPRTATDNRLAAVKDLRPLAELAAAARGANGGAR